MRRGRIDQSFKNTCRGPEKGFETVFGEKTAEVGKEASFVERS